MRALPVGWANLRGDHERRRALAVKQAAATHGCPEAQLAAALVAALGQWALDGSAPAALAMAAADEADALAALLGAHGAAVHVRAAAEGTWSPPPAGIPLDATATVAAVVHVLSRHTSPAAAMRAAVLLGGDTDTVAAIVGGVLGGCLGVRTSDLPWLGAVLLPDAARIRRVAERLAALRLAS
jgi:ADP-ribosylglycohydrolase